MMLKFSNDQGLPDKSKYWLLKLKERNINVGNGFVKKDETLWIKCFFSGKEFEAQIYLEALVAGLSKEDSQKIKIVKENGECFVVVPLSINIEVKNLDTQNLSFTEKRLVINPLTKTQRKKLISRLPKLEKNEDYPKCLHMIGYAYFSENNFKEAFVYYKKAYGNFHLLKDNLEKAAIILNYAVLCLKFDKLEDGLREFQNVIKELAQDISITNQKIAEEMREVAKNQMRVLYPQVINRYSEEKKYSDALSIIEQAIKDGEELTKYYLLKVRIVYLQTQNFNSGITAASEAIEKLGADANWMLYYMRGSFYLEINNYEEAIKDLDQAILLNGENDAIFSDRGRCYYHMGLFELAMQSVDQALKINPKNPQALYNKGLLIVAEQKTALHLFDQANKNSSSEAFQASVLQKQLDVFLSKDEYEKAILLLRKMLSMENKNIKTDFCYYAISYSQIKLGQNKLALTNINEAIKTKKQALYYFQKAYLHLLQKEEKYVEDAMEAGVQLMVDEFKILEKSELSEEEKIEIARTWEMFQHVDSLLMDNSEKKPKEQPQKTHSSGNFSIDGMEFNVKFDEKFTRKCPQKYEDILNSLEGKKGELHFTGNIGQKGLVKFTTNNNKHQQQKFGSQAQEMRWYIKDPKDKTRVSVAQVVEEDQMPTLIIGQNFL